MITEARTDADITKLLHEKSPALIVFDFYATWCGPCKMLDTLIRTKLSMEFPDVMFVKANVDKLEDSSTKLGVSALPTLILVKSGIKKEVIIGFDEKKIRNAIEKHRK